MPHDILITICCRQGSKGLSHKNTRLLWGKPLCEWSMIQADEWSTQRGGAMIAISTDDPKVKRLALKHEFWTIDRPPELCEDDTPKVQAIRHAWATMEKRLAIHYDYVLDLDVCNPMRTLKDIDIICQMMEENPLTIFSVTRARRNPFFNMYPVMGNYTRRQDAPIVYDLNNCIYAYSREFLLSDRVNAITERSSIYQMLDWTFCDIDSELDFFLVEKLMERYGKEMGQTEN